MQVAAAGSSFAILEILLREGARIDLTDVQGLTALHVSCSVGDLPSIEALIAHCRDEFDPSQLAHVKSQFSLLHFAVQGGNASALETIVKKYPMLLRQGDAAGDTPLHLAAKLGSEKMVVALLSLGASPLDKNKQLLVPSEVAAENRHEHVREILEEASAALILGEQEKVESEAREKSAVLKALEAARPKKEAVYVPPFHGIPFMIPQENGRGDQKIGSTGSSKVSPSSSEVQQFEDMASAIANNSAMGVRGFLKLGYPPNEKIDHLSPLMLACFYGAESAAQVNFRIFGFFPNIFF